MRILTTSAAALALTATMAITAVTPSSADDRAWVAGGVGFAAGALVGSAAANANARYYHGPGYAYHPYGYAYAPAPGYYAPGYVHAPGAYAYAPGAYAYAPSYNPEQPYDPDPRIGGSLKKSTND